MEKATGNPQFQVVHKKGIPVLAELGRHHTLYLMALPAIVFFIVFSYLPLVGIYCCGANYLSWIERIICHEILRIYAAFKHLNNNIECVKNRYQPSEPDERYLSFWALAHRGREIPLHAWAC